MKYKILQSIDVTGLAQLVEEALLGGYYLVGSPVAFAGLLLQAVAKNAPQPVGQAGK